MTITDNNVFKVLIPTAGTGSRLGQNTKFLNKSLVSIENKPVISYIIEMFPKNTEFVIALGYKAELVKQYLKLAHPNIKFDFAQVEKYEGEGSGLGLSILACEKFLHCPFVFCSCDTIVKEKIPYPDTNIAGYAYRTNKQEYRTLVVNNDDVLQIKEKNEADNNSAPYIGLACIHDWELFWQEMNNGGNDAIKLGETYALLKFVQKNSLKAKQFTWFDTGNNEELEKTRAYFKQIDSPNILPKADEAIWFTDDNVIKFSDNKDFIRDRVERVKYLKGFVPDIIAYTENMYMYKKASGFVLSKINDINIFKNLLSVSQKFWDKKILNEEDNNKFKNTCKKFYYTKTVERIEKYYNTFNMQDAETVINGKSLPKLSTILEKVDWNNIFNGLAGRFHGDFHFENIIYDDKNNQFTFLDWRQNFGGIIEFGDIYYDLAKLNHGLIICHELIAQNRFNVDIKDNNINYSFERKPVLEECEKFYYQWLKENNYDVKKVKVLTALIYLNIAALHHYPYCHLLYFLGKNMLFENI